MGHQCHVVAVGIGAEIGPQCGYHVMFSHEFDRRNGQFFDVLCGRQQHCCDVITGHSLYAFLRQLHRVISTYSRWLTPSAPTSYAISPDYRLLSSSPWKLGMRPSCFPACMMRVLLSLSKNFLSQNTSINLGLIYPRSHASFTAGSWEWMTSWVCSSSVFPLGMACAPQKVAIKSIVPFICWRTISIARSIFTSASAFSPYPDLTQTVVVPRRLILLTYLVRCATRDSRGDWLICSVVYLMPSPSLQMSTQFFPFSFMSNSRERSPANKACVCASTNPGKATRPLQSFSFSKEIPSFSTHWATSSFGPTLDITPAWSMATEQFLTGSIWAAFWSVMKLLGEAATVSSCRMLESSSLCEDLFINNNDTDCKIEQLQSKIVKYLLSSYLPNIGTYMRIITFIR